MNTTETKIQISGACHALLPQAVKITHAPTSRAALLGWSFYAERDSDGFIEWAFQWGKGEGSRIDKSLHGGPAAKSSKNLPLPQHGGCESLAASGFKVGNRFDWREVPPALGHLRGLRHVRGWLTATDGIRGLMLCGATWFLCHLSNFVEKRSASTTPRRGHLQPLPTGLVV